MPTSFSISFPLFPSILGECDPLGAAWIPQDTEGLERRAALGVLRQTLRDLGSLDGKQGGALEGTEEKPGEGYSFSEKSRGKNRKKSKKWAG